MPESKVKSNISIQGKPMNQNPELNRIPNYCPIHVQQGLKIRGFWFQKKTVQLKTVLREVYTYVVNEIFFQKTVYLQGFC